VVKKHCCRSKGDTPEDEVVEGTVNVELWVVCLLQPLVLQQLMVHRPTVIDLGRYCDSWSHVAEPQLFVGMHDPTEVCTWPKIQKKISDDNVYIKTKEKKQKTPNHHSKFIFWTFTKSVVTYSMNCCNIFGISRFKLWTQLSRFSQQLEEIKVLLTPSKFC